jgi:membrane-anchored glycerophosphoryl diester phosphodiesterase (GDPDase)
VQPGVVPLRPLGLGELFDGAVRTMRQNPRVMFGVSAVLMAITAVLSLVVLLVGVRRLTQTLTGAEDGLTRDEVAAAASSGLLTFGVPAVLQALATIVLTGILILAVSDAVLGRRPAVSDVVHRVGSRIWRLLGLSLLTALFYLVLAVVLAAPGLALIVASQEVAGGIALALAVPVFVVVACLLWVRLAFAAPALLLERVGVGRALQRSWRLTVGSWWRVFGVLLLTAVIAVVAGGLLSAPFGLVGTVVAEALGGGSPDDGTAFRNGLLVSQAIANIGSVLASTVTAPFTAAVTALLYIDLRIRREGLDVALARAAAQPATPTS